MAPDRFQPASKRRHVYLAQDMYVAVLDAKLIDRLKSEIQQEIDQNRSSGIGLVERVLAEVEFEELDFTDHYDQNVEATYLLVDRYVKAPASMRSNETLAANPGQPRPVRPTLLHVMGKLDGMTVEELPGLPTVQLGFWEKLKK